MDYLDWELARDQAEQAAWCNICGEYSDYEWQCECCRECEQTHAACECGSEEDEYNNILGV